MDNLSIEEKLDSYSSVLCLFYTKYPSSNFATVIMSPVCSGYGVLYGIYETDGLIVIASDYRCDVYTNTPEKLSLNKTSCEETISAY